MATDFQRDSATVTTPTAPTIALDLTWRRFDKIAAALADAVRVDGVPDLIVGIARGGVVPAVMLAHRLEVRTVRQIDARRTVSDRPLAAKLDTPVLHHADHVVDCRAQDVLLVDDVAGSGATLSAVAALLHAASPARLRTVVTVVNTATWNQPDPQGGLRPDLDYVGLTCAGWARFPWELR